MQDKTQTFSIGQDRPSRLRTALGVVYDALVEKGYNPVNQIVGYLLSEDPTYITTYNNARSIISKMDRDELLQELIRSYVADREIAPDDDESADDK